MTSSQMKICRLMNRYYVHSCLYTRVEPTGLGDQSKIEIYNKNRYMYSNTQCMHIDRTVLYQSSVTCGYNRHDDNGAPDGKATN